LIALATCMFAFMRIAVLLLCLSLAGCSFGTDAPFDVGHLPSEGQLKAGLEQGVVSSPFLTIEVTDTFRCLVSAFAGAD